MVDFCLISPIKDGLHLSGHGMMKLGGRENLNSAAESYIPPPIFSEPKLLPPFSPAKVTIPPPPHRSTIKEALSGAGQWTRKVR